MEKRSLTEFGLTSETLFDIDLAMPYWLQLGHQEFLMSVIHELKMQPISSNAFLKDIAEDEQIANLPVARCGNKKTVKEVCEIILWAMNALSFSFVKLLPNSACTRRVTLPVGRQKEKAKR